MSAVQFTPCTAYLRGGLCAFEPVFGGEIDDRGEHGADQDPQELIPVEERDADPGGLDLVVERRPQRGDELDDEQQVPPAPATPLPLPVIHCDNLIRSEDAGPDAYGHVRRTDHSSFLHESINTETRGSMLDLIIRVDDVVTPQG